MNIQTISFIISNPLRVVTPLILAALGELVNHTLTLESLPFMAGECQSALIREAMKNEEMQY